MDGGTRSFGGSKPAEREGERMKEREREREGGRREPIDFKCAAVCRAGKYCCRQHSQELSMANPKSNVTIS
jgi:hypothetical protein